LPYDTEIIKLIYNFLECEKLNRWVRSVTFRYGGTIWTITDGIMGTYVTAWFINDKSKFK